MEKIPRPIFCTFGFGHHHRRQPSSDLYRLRSKLNPSFTLWLCPLMSIIIMISAYVGKGVSSFSFRMLQKIPQFNLSIYLSIEGRKDGMDRWMDGSFPSFCGFSFSHSPTVGDEVEGRERRGGDRTGRRKEAVDYSSSRPKKEGESCLQASLYREEEGRRKLQRGKKIRCLLLLIYVIA